MSVKLVIREGFIAEIVALSQQIPEFINPHAAQEYQTRLSKVPHLILVACDAQTPIAFKVGYQRENDGSFYSWMGAVLPAYRRHRVALNLATHQEIWARQQGYTCIRFKTRNRLKNMLLFSLKNGFDVIHVEPRTQIEEYRITLEKKL